MSGATGSVGSAAVEIAVRFGATVMAAAGRPGQLTTEPAVILDLRQDDLAQQMLVPTSGQRADLVFDTVGGETLERSWAVLKPNGRMVTIAADAEGNTDGRVKQAFFIVEPNRKELIEIGKLLDAGQLQTTVDAVVPFSQAPAAFTGAVQGRLGRGKLVVTLAAAGSAIGIG